MDWLEFIKQSGDGPFKAAMLFGIFHVIHELRRVRKIVEKLTLDLAVETANLKNNIKSSDRRLTNLERKIV